MNRLGNEKSAYLRHASGQKIDWQPWSEEAFAQAKREDKPVFLSTGAIWCHWCHVMAKECFEDDGIASLLNEHFVSIKLDRDERPDVDRRYQKAVAAMGNGSGWPLTVFLTPDGMPFFGGTYFPPEDSLGRPGFRKVLQTVAHFYRTNREEITSYTKQLIDYLRPESRTTAIDRAMSEKAASAILAEFDPQNGGFGAAPKFPLHSCIEFLMNRFVREEKEPAAIAVKKTLGAMAKGGFHDQLKGGFHRYSVDESWVIPHFEKMADDNAWLLRNYVNAYALFGDSLYKSVAGGIITFVRDVLSDPDGGFFTSQDADVTPDDEGGYFTWTKDDFRKALTDEEYRVLSLHLLHDRGAMRHDPARKVLFVALDPEDVAARAGMDVRKTIETIESGKKKLLAARDARTAPFVDTAFYSSLNGMMITSFLHAYRVLGSADVKDFALRSLDKILKMRLSGESLSHTAGVQGFLDDYVYMIEALVSAYEVTAEREFLNQADLLMESCIRRFLDEGTGGFFDSEQEVMGIRLKPVEDVPHPSANSVGIMQLISLYNMTGKGRYLYTAEKALAAFSSDAQDMGIHASYYFCGLDAYFTMIRLGLDAGPESRLARAALGTLLPYHSVVYGTDRGAVTPCVNGVCLEPLSTPEKLKEFLKRPSLQ
ncbi:MAG: thioredoxin domain-containing protein [Nitrospiraceae bacterium]|nr:thioredoxin domain-containing protein [Nitrospiraceae bacterium]